MCINASNQLVFLNRMLDLLRSSHPTPKIYLTPDFKRDLKWLEMFLPWYKGVSLYNHRQIHMALDLDACLTGFGGRCGHYIIFPLFKVFETGP